MFHIYLDILLSVGGPHQNELISIPMEGDRQTQTDRRMDRQSHWLEPS